MPRYENLQHGFAHYLLWASGVAAGVLGLVGPGSHDGPVLALVMPAGFLMALTPFFAWLRTRDTGDALEASFGPIPLLRKRVAYDTIRAVSPQRSHLIDGLGIHLGPQGWIWNIWGWDCVRLELEEEDGTRRTLRIGTDDVDGLMRLLEAKRPKPDPIRAATAELGAETATRMGRGWEIAKGAGLRLKRHVHELTA